MKDDFDWLLDKMYDADGILWSVPIFEKGATALFHILTDRFGLRMDRGNVTIADKIPWEKGGPRMDPRFLTGKVVSYMGVGGSDWMTRIQCDFGMRALPPMWKAIDTEVFSWSLDIVMSDASLDRAKEIGRNIVQAAKNPEQAEYHGPKGI